MAPHTASNDVGPDRTISRDPRALVSHKVVAVTASGAMGSLLPKCNTWARALPPPRRSALPWLLGASQYFGATISSPIGEAQNERIGGPFAGPSACGATTLRWCRFAIQPRHVARPDNPDAARSRHTGRRGPPRPPRRAQPGPSRAANSAGSYRRGDCGLLSSCLLWGHQHFLPAWPHRPHICLPGLDRAFTLPSPARFPDRPLLSRLSPCANAGRVIAVGRYPGGGAET